jgi:glycosyltransferase involved in cell wall biosynthesis
MNNQPLVSVIIPHFNHGEYIVDALNSIYNSEYENLEVIIIDDASTDINSREVLNNLNYRYKDLSILEQTNAGPSVAKNKGANFSKGKYLFFLDADNMVLPNYIIDAVNILENNPEVAIVYADYECFGEINSIHISGELNPAKLPIENSIDNCVIIRKEVFLNVGGFDEKLSKMGLEDWELWINLYKNGFKFFYLKKVSFKYRVLNTSRTELSANKKLVGIRAYVFNKHIDFILNLYSELYYKNKQLLETPDFKIGKILLKPYRFLKNLLK